MVSTTQKTTKPRARKNKNNSEILKISVAEAAEKMGVTEEFIKASVLAIYPEGTAEITLNEFQAIAEALQEELQSAQPIIAQPQTGDSSVINTESPQQSELITDEKTDLISSEIPTALAQSEPDDLVEQINYGVTNSLAFIQDYTLVLEKISSALAYAAAKQAVNNFVKIHRSVFENELENYLNDFATEASDAVKTINQVSAKDFLEQKGILPKPKRLVEEILALYPGLQ